mgnify:FL=1
MKTLDDIFDEYCDQDLLIPQTLKELIWHLEHDADPARSISRTTDMGLKKLAPCIAKHLDHEDDYVRELSVGCLLGRLKLPEYAEIGFKMAQEDPDSGPRSLAIFRIGEVLNEIKEKNLQHQIAFYLYQILMGVKEKGSSSKKGSAYNSILAPMEVSIPGRPGVRDLATSIDFDLLELTI